MLAFTKGLVDDKTQEQKIKGLQPKNRISLYTYISLMWMFAVSLSTSILCFVFLNYFPISSTMITDILELGFTYLLVFSVLFIVLAILVKQLMLRKCGFDDWVYEIANATLGTNVIFYNSKSIYIQYNRNNKEVDKKEFVQKMTERSERFSYFYIKTWVDEGFIEVRCTPRQEIPKRVLWDKDLSSVPNFVPIGVGLNTVTKELAPVGWYFNSNQIDEKSIVTEPAVSIAIVGTSGSGKSVALNGIMSHVCKFPDNISVIGVDLKGTEFELFMGVKGFKGFADNAVSAVEALEACRVLMDERKNFEKQYKVNNIYKVGEVEVPYYELFGKTYQFDEMFYVELDITPNLPNHRLLTKHIKGNRYSTFMTIETLYNKILKKEISNPKVAEVKGYNSYLNEFSIKKKTGTFKPKVVIVMVDELNELMDSDYEIVDKVSTALKSIARIGRSHGMHLVLAMQSANGKAMSGDLRTNVKQSVLFGDFDSTASMNLFERDYTDMCKPKIKGRGLLKDGKDIIELQGYFVEQEKTFVFDEDMKWTYDSREYAKQCELLGKEIDESGFVEQVKLSDDFVVQSTITESDFSNKLLRNREVYQRKVVKDKVEKIETDDSSKQVFINSKNKIEKLEKNTAPMFKLDIKKK